MSPESRSCRRELIIGGDWIETTALTRDADLHCSYGLFDCVSLYSFSRCTAGLVEPLPSLMD